MDAEQERILYKRLNALDAAIKKLTADMMEVKVAIGTMIPSRKTA